MLPNAVKTIFISTLFLLLTLPPTSCAIVQWKTRATHMGLLAYIQGGDLWVKALPNDQPQRLTTDGRNCCPFWSPSGQWLAHLKGDELWVVRSSGADAKALSTGAKGYRFAWSSVSDTLAYETTEGVYLASAGDWHGRALFADSYGWAWSPNGRWLASGRMRALEGTAHGEEIEAGLWRIRADGSGATELFKSDQTIIVSAWYGEHILFYSYPAVNNWGGPGYLNLSLLSDGLVNLNAIPANGGAPRVLAGGMLLHADFRDGSPGGKFLAITEGGGRETWSAKRIVVVDLSSGERTPLTDDKTAAFSPAWSPNGQRIAYVAGPDIGDVGGGEEAKAGAAQRRIWVINRDGSARYQLTTDAAYRDERPLWSADNGHILFVRFDHSDRVSLWLMGNDGSKLHKVVDELSPAPEWWGFYGYTDWYKYFDWWPGAAPVPNNRLQPTPYSVRFAPAFGCG